MGIRIDTLVNLCVERNFPDYWILSQSDFVIAAHVRLRDHRTGPQGCQFIRNPQAALWSVALLYRGQQYFSDRVRSSELLEILKAR